MNSLYVGDRYDLVIPHDNCINLEDYYDKSIEFTGTGYVELDYKFEKLLDVPYYSGKKTVNALYYLLKNDIIDRPILIECVESMLSPLYQVEFMLLVGKIINNFGVDFILGTHSPFILNAVEVLMEYYDFKVIKCDDCDDIKDVSETLSEAYTDSADAMQYLERLEYTY